MFQFKYKTTKNKRITVFIKDDKTIWIGYDELVKLFNVPYDEINISMQKRELEGKFTKENVIEYDGKELINLIALLHIGIGINRMETLSLLDRYNFITKEYDTKTSEEFVESIKSIMNVKQV